MKYKKGKFLLLNRQFVIYHEKESGFSKWESNFFKVLIAAKLNLKQQNSRCDLDCSQSLIYFVPQKNMNMNITVKLGRLAVTSVCKLKHYVELWQSFIFAKNVTVRQKDNKDNIIRGPPIIVNKRYGLVNGDCCVWFLPVISVSCLVTHSEVSDPTR